METQIRKPTYIRPPGKNVPVGADDVPLLEIPDAQAEANRAADIKDRLRRIQERCLKTAGIVDAALALIERGVTLPDVAYALGLPPTIDRVSRPLNTWRIRSNTNMDVIATMLEEAGTKGVSETEMIAKLRDLGRLTTADMPLRAVHWTISELRRRTKFIERRSRANGARWYAYGKFDVWRDRAHKSSAAKLQIQKRKC